MINDIQNEAKDLMEKALVALDNAFKRVRTGRASPSILDGVKVSYYGADTALAQLANIIVEDGRTLAVIPWEKPLVPVIEKAIMKSNLGLNPATNGDTIRLVMPMLTEETRKDFIKVARSEAERGRVSVRNARQAANSNVKALLKEKDISEDEARNAEDAIQTLTNTYIKKVDTQLASKEKDLMTV
jgi:ribosome recycling factor